MQQVMTELQRLGRQGRSMLTIQRVAVLIGWTVGAVLALILIDFALRLPGALRFVLLLAGLGAIGYFFWTYVRPALLFSPTLTQLALRAERVMPSMAGRLASSVEFAAAGLDEGNALAARAVHETETRLGGESLGRIIDKRRTWRDVGIMFGVLLLAGFAAIADPGSALIGLQRVFAPYGDTKWPARTGVESLMHASVHPRGQALPLRAGVTRGPAEQRLDAHYRLRIDGAYQPWQRVVLTHQQGGALHERLIDPAGSADELELYFASEDDQTELQIIALVAPPAVRRASLVVQPPDYAAPHVSVKEFELGQGVDHRAVTDSPSLVGSRAALRLELNKPLPIPQSPAKTLGWSEEEMSAAVFAVDPVTAAEAVDPPRTTWTVEWTLTGTQSFSLQLVDEHGLSNFDPIGYRVEAVQDLPPSATIISPESDETVLPTAIVSIAAQAGDDVAVAHASLEAHVQAGGRSIEEAMVANPAWTHQTSAGQVEATLAADLELAPLHLKEGDTVLITALATDVYREAQPDAPDAARHQTRSALRRLRVISETDFATQLRRQLSAVRQNAIRIESQQAELQEDIAENSLPEGSGMDRAQAQISERIAAQRESVQDIARLMQQNRLNDAQLSQLLQQSNDLLDAAGRAANRAVEAMESRQNGTTAQNDPREANETSQESTPAQSDPTATEAQRPSGDRQPGQAERPKRSGENESAESEPASRAEPQDGQQDNQRSPDADLQLSEEDREVVEAQQEVRDELTDLIKLLDRDEDTWVVRRQLDTLLREQQELEAATAQIGEQTTGIRPEDLTQDQRTELDRIAQRQRDLRDEARKMIENMRQRARALEQIDPQSARAMRSAADTAEQRQLDQDMENAAQRAQQNQMTSAAAAQQSAQSTMQRMQEDIENTRRAQAQQLIRQLASLVESIQRLITVQENELVALGLAEDTKNYAGLDRGMIRLNQNTQAVAGEARTAGAEARRIGRSLDRAADAQGAAVAALRATPVNSEGASEAENRSLQLLKEAKASAEELQQQTQEREMQRRREELITSYRAFAEKQVVVREETLPLSGLPELDRRQIVEARRLATAQDEIRTGLNGLRDSTSEILDSPIFVHVHRAIDGWSSTVSDSLAGGTVNVDVTDRQRQIADSIGRLIKALEESTATPEEFAQNQQQQQQQGGQSGEEQDSLIPPIAQLKLLREIQEQVYSLTKDMDARNDLDEAQKRTRLREVGQQQRELLDLGRQMLEMLENNQPQPEPMPTPSAEPAPEQPQGGQDL